MNFLGFYYFIIYYLLKVSLCQESQGIQGLTIPFWPPLSNHDQKVHSDMSVVHLQIKPQLTGAD